MKLVALARIERQNAKGQRSFVPPGAVFEESDKETLNRLKAKKAANPATKEDEARAEARGLKETPIPGRVRSLRERRAYREAAEEMEDRATANAIRKASNSDTSSGGNPADDSDPGSNDGSDGAKTGETTGAGGGMDTTKLSQSSGTSRQGGPARR